MKTVILKKITLIYFKGIKNLTITFDDHSTNIFGDNGTGKTTIFDAFEWLRSGKDSNDRTNFEIKTLDSNNVAIPQIEHEVAAEWLVDGSPVSMRRILVEKWTKKKGSEFSEFTGNETKYFWNDVPKSQKEYNDLVSGILDETIFKLITNPLAFNNDKTLPWEKRRDILTKMAGEVSFEQLAGDNAEYLELLSNLTQGKTLEEYKKQIIASITKAKLELKAIPVRIDEATKGRPIDYDFKTLKSLLESKEAELVKIEDLISNRSLAVDDMIDKNTKIKTKVADLKFEIQTIETKTKREALSAAEILKPDDSIKNGLIANLSSIKDDLEASEKAMATLKSNVVTKEHEVVLLTSKMTAKRNEWTAENAKELKFDDGAFCCPTCQRDFEPGDVEEKKKQMATNFAAEKQTNLALLSSQGINFKTEKENVEAELETVKSRIIKGDKMINDLKNKIIEIEAKINAVEVPAVDLKIVDFAEVERVALAQNETYQSKKTELEALEKTIQEIPVVDVTDLQNQKAVLKEDMDLIKTKLSNETQIAAIDQRIGDLKSEEKKLANQISTVEKTQFTIENFNRLRIENIENSVNSKFKNVKFKLFETQVNGGEIECCKALLNGVPFSDLNTASTINAGLDVINTLCEFYQVNAPIFIDNRESIVNVIDVKSQMINLIVSEGSELNVGAPKMKTELSKTLF